MSYKKLKVIAIVLSILIVIGLIGIGVVCVVTNSNNTTTTLADENGEMPQSVGKNSEVGEASSAVETSKEYVDLKEVDNRYIPEYEDLYFELPLNGATGYASISANIRAKASSNSSIVTKLNPGQGFKILSEEGEWLKISANGKTGYINSTCCMVNLPDIIPSIVYDDTNSYSSLFRSSEIAIPNVTGKQLYNNKAYNKRLSKEQYMMPVMYDMAKKIMKAQELAKADGYSLKIYETFRPYEAQSKVAKNLSKLMKSNKTVYNGINGGGWNEGWFIAQVLSNHQRGIAMDVSLVKINDYEAAKCGTYKYMNVIDYTEEAMPTQMHELSNKAISMQYAVDSNSKTAWKDVPMAKGMTDGAKRLRNYCVEAGLSPLCSEWWHFNDLDAREKIGNNYSTGRYEVSGCFSSLPE